jgi:3'(2'), 5'-bisphosphate nucleotidase
MSDQPDDAVLSRDIAREAGQLLLEIRREFYGEEAERGHGAVGDRQVADRLRDTADARSNDLILDRLHAARPDDAVLSEEAKDDDSRLAADRVWIVDPLDGTWEYGQNRRDFAVHIALWAGDELRACTVDLPAQQLTRSVLDPVAPTALPSDRPIRLVASRSRPPATLERTRDALARIVRQAKVNDYGVEIVDVGSVGAKVGEILAGRADGYLHDTGFYEWDVAAPYGVAAHYGLRVCHLDGSAVTFNHMPPYVQDLVVAHSELYPYLRQALAEASGS